MSAVRNQLDWLLQVIFTTLRLYVRNGLANHAAATAFYFLLSTTPLLLLLAYALQWLERFAETSQLATLLLAALYEHYQLDSLADMGFIPSRAGLGASGIGLVTLLLFSRKLVYAIEKAFTVIFPEDERRRLVISWTLPLVIIPIAFGLVGVAVILRGTLDYLVTIELLGPARALVLNALNLLVVLALVWSLVLLAYWRLPLRHPRLRQAATVALLASLSLYLLFLLFERFFQIDQYRAVYGALGGVVLVLIAAYFAFLAFYLWAQYLYALTQVDVAALEKLFLSASGEAMTRMEGYVFGRADRLLAKYGQRFAAGETLIREGERSQTAYFLHSGRVAFFKENDGTQLRLGEIGTGELFGEMAYLLDEPRTATVVAQTDVVVLALPPETLEALMRYSAPLSRRIITALSQRLRHMTQVAAAA